MKNFIPYSFFLLLLPSFSLAQNLAVNNDGSTAHPNAVLDVKGINKGLLIPRGDAATRTALNTNTAKGLLLYDTVLNTVWMHNGNGLATGWSSLSTGTNYWQLNGALGTEIKNTNAGGFWSANATTVSSDPGIIQPPVSGAGTRIMWMPQKSAFRVGTVDNIQWDAAFIGASSFASGYNNIASGTYSTAMGRSADATGNYSTAMGYITTAAGEFSTAMGRGTNATAHTATAMGYNTNAFGASSTSMGYNTTASGNYSIASGFASTASGSNSMATGTQTNASGVNSTTIGSNTTASGGASTAMGIYTTASGGASTAMGELTHSKAYASLAMGRYNDTIVGSNPISWVTTDPLLILGNGTSLATPSNALVVYKNGNTDVSGYTQLGKPTEAAPAIKMKKLTLNTSVSQGDCTFIAHGLTQSKILSISGLLVTPTGGYQILPNHLQAGFQYTLNVDNTNIAVCTVAGSSASILNATVKIVVVYEE